ncbi:MAG: hypothetical protein ACOVNR_04740 [Chitinophagaceae bacterium]
MRQLVRYCSFMVMVSVLVACQKQTDNFSATTINQYYPLAVGKTFIYRLDSTVTANFGAQLVTKSYIAKDTVESVTTDAQGNKQFRIFRYLTDTLQTQPWQYTATYATIVYNNKVEYNDQNLRFITLVNPVNESTTWKGNTQVSAIGSPFYFLTNWIYQYQNINQPYTVLKGTIPETITVQQANDQSSPVFNPNNVFFKNYSIEVYAKDIGLIYKEFLHINYQVTIQNNTIINRYYVNDNSDITFGVKLSLISNR